MRKIKGGYEMDPIIIGLGAKIVEKLMPYVTEGTEKLTQAIGDVAVNKLEKLLHTLKTRLSGDETATDMLAEFEKNPETFKPALQKILQKKLEQDKDLAMELDKQIKDIPIISIKQKIGKVNKDAIALKGKNIKRANINIDQEVGDASGNVKGIVVDDIG